MAIHDWDGATGHPVQSIHDWDGTTAHPTQRIYDWDGAVDHPIWNHEEPGPGPGPSEQTETLEVSGLQDNVWHSKAIQAGDYSTVTVLNFVPAQSYGSASTYLAVYRNGWPECVMRDMTRTYTGTGFSDTMNRYPQDVYQGLQPGDTIELWIKTSYDPNVSGQGTSTATATIKLSK